jgi:hypothetical protein
MLLALNMGYCTTQAVRDRSGVLGGWGPCRHGSRPRISCSAAVIFRLW